jgi:hypothetical protein
MQLLSAEPFRFLMRLFTVTACLAGSGLAPILAVFALQSMLRIGPWALAIVGLWLLAFAALAVISLTWVLNVRLGKTAATAACVVGTVGLLAFPLCAAVLGQEQWLSEFSGAFGMALLATFPSVLLAVRLAYYHATGSSEQQPARNSA